MQYLSSDVENDVRWIFCTVAVDSHYEEVHWNRTGSCGTHCDQVAHQNLEAKKEKNSYFMLTQKDANGTPRRWQDQSLWTDPKTKNLTR